MRTYLDTRHYNMPYYNVPLSGLGATLALDPASTPATVADLEAAKADSKKTVLMVAVATVGLALVADYFFSKRKYRANARRRARKNGRYGTGRLGYHPLSSAYPFTRTGLKMRARRRARRR